jgi:hypothetical protein
VQWIAELVSGMEVLLGLGEYEVLCEDIANMPDMLFVINRLDYAVTPEDYILKVTSAGESACILGFLGLDLPMGPWWILREVRKYVLHRSSNDFGTIGWVDTRFCKTYRKEACGFGTCTPGFLLQHSKETHPEQMLYCMLSKCAGREWGTFTSLNGLQGHLGAQGAPHVNHQRYFDLPNWTSIAASESYVADDVYFAVIGVIFRGLTFVRSCF